MLKVSSTSWHYRLRGQIFEDPPKDLCRYFWSTVASAILCALIAVGYALYWVFRPLGRLLGRGFRRFGRFAQRHDEAFGTGITVLLIGLLAAMVLFLVGWLVWALLYNTWDFLHGVLVVLMWVGIVALILAVAVLLLLAIAGFVHLVKKWNRERPPKPAEAVDNPTKPVNPKKKKVEGDSTWTLAWTFIKAKKRKVCPLIQVVGEETNEPERHLRAV